jgi:glycerophosphoryl diester phosphodiesterase
MDIQGHRGARALFPENTLQGFIAAAALGITAFELDVGMTADGVVVVHHDLALNPDLTRDAAGAWLNRRGPLIRSLNFADLQCRPVTPWLADRAAVP